MLPRVPTNLCSCLDKIHATTHAPTAELQLSRDTVSINPSLTLRSVLFEDGHRNTGSVSLTPSSILSSNNNNGLAREFFKHLPRAVFDLEMERCVLQLLLFVRTFCVVKFTLGCQRWEVSLDRLTSPQSLPPFHLPPSPAFHVILDFPSFLPPGAANNIQILGNLWQSLNVRRDKIWRHTKCDDSMGNSMKYDSWQLTDQ